jgi:hypothetical protein
VVACVIGSPCKRTPCPSLRGVGRIAFFEDLRGLKLADRQSINEAIETPRKFPEMRKLIFQLHKPLFDSEELLITMREFGAGISWGGGAVIKLLDKKYPRPSRLRNAGTKSCSFGFCIFDRGTHDHPDETQSALIRFPVALCRAKVEPVEAKHYALLNIRH